MIKGIKLYDKEKTPNLGQFDVPDGKYDFEVVDVKTHGGSDESKMPSIGVQCEVKSGTYAGTKLWAFWSLPLEKDPPEHFRRQLWRDICQSCPACSNDGEGLEETALKGLTFSATVYHETYNEVERCRFKSYRFGKPGEAKKSTSTASGPSKFSAPPSS